MRRFVFAVLLAIFAFCCADAQKPPILGDFFPMNVGTYWVYKGTVRWADSETDKPVSGEVTWKMTVEKVIRKRGLLAAVVSGFPADLDWSAGSTEPKPWLIIEDEKHQVYYENLGPDYNLSKLDGDERVFDKFLVDDNFFFQAPLRRENKYCDAEAKKRDDNMYCWVVTAAAMKKLDAVKGAPLEAQPVYQLEYHSLPDSTTMELVPGLGVLSYEYHHHGSVADTELQLVEFHPAPVSSETQGQKP